MALALALASLFAQLLGFVGIGFLIADLLVLPGVFYPEGNWTVAGLLPYALDTFFGYWPLYLLCGIGAVTSAALMISDRYRAGWYVSLCRILGWLWIPLLPVGTVLGVILIRARIYALRSGGA